MEQELEIAEGGEAEIKLERGERLFAQWYLVQPLGPGGKPMGELMQGTLQQEKPRGRVELEITSRTGSGDYFAPLVSNWHRSLAPDHRERRAPGCHRL